MKFNMKFLEKQKGMEATTHYQDKKHIMYFFPFSALLP